MSVVYVVALEAYITSLLIGHILLFHFVFRFLHRVFLPVIELLEMIVHLLGRRVFVVRLLRRWVVILLLLQIISLLGLAFFHLVRRIASLMVVGFVACVIGHTWFSFLFEILVKNYEVIHLGRVRVELIVFPEES